jgi:sugar O-acyltransferase (sialic acid O-acetyltransferase NeuD family)
MRRRLIILGTSGLAREMAMVAEHVNAREHFWEIYGFIGHNLSEIGKNLGVACIIGDDEWLLSQDFETDILIGIGYPELRADILTRYLDQGERFGYPNLVHPKASFDYRRIELGRGNVITSGCSFTCDIKVQDFNLFNLNTTVGHDVCIGSFNVINPSVNISGGVHFADRILAGTGCQILENLWVGADVIIGAGAVVRNNVPNGQTVVGIPAKPIKRDRTDF